MKYPKPFLALLSLYLATCGTRAEEEEEEVVTTVPVFLPYYSSKSWSLVRGSIVTSVRRRIPSNPGLRAVCLCRKEACALADH